MSITFVSVANTTTETPKRNGSTKALPVNLIDLNQPGRLRKGHLMTLLGLKSTTLWARLAEGSVPPPSGYDGKTGKHDRPYWNNSVIKDYLNKNT